MDRIFIETIQCSTKVFLCLTIQFKTNNNNKRSNKEWFKKEVIFLSKIQFIRMLCQINNTNIRFNKEFLKTELIITNKHHLPIET